jgi:hypothetical protein
MTFAQYLEEEFNRAKNTHSDINRHMQLLYDLASECETVIEMGCRTGNSTRAFLHADVKLKSYDINIDVGVKQIFDEAVKYGKEVEYIRGNTLRIEIEECDFLFIDTLHQMKQLREELKLHGNKARKYLAFHDTHTFGCRDEKAEWRQDQQTPVPPENEGLIGPVIDFVIANPHWKFKIHRSFNNGLTVLERE